MFIRPHWRFASSSVPRQQGSKGLQHESHKSILHHWRGLGPHLTQSIIADLVKSNLPFSVYFDKTKTSQVKKQLDIMLRYWSPKHEEMWTVFYTSLFFEYAQGELVAARMYSKMVEGGIPVQRLATLVRDGPNVNKAIFQKLNKLIKGFPGLMDLGTCTIHTVHNAFNKGMEQYGKEVDKLCLDLHTLSTLLQDKKTSKEFKLR